MSSRIRIWAIIKTRFSGVHRWQKCDIKSVAFLKRAHHHYFDVEARIEQFHDARDVEYIVCHRMIDEFLRTLKVDGQSCEMLASTIKDFLAKKYPNRRVTVGVSEEGINGAVIEDVEGDEHLNALNKKGKSEYGSRTR